MPVFVLTQSGNFCHVDTDELARRLRTARAYAGHRSVEAVAKAINQKGLGVKTLRKIESGNRPAQKRDLQAIADACGLPVDFFTADEPFSSHAEDVRLDRIEARLNVNSEALEVLLKGLANGGVAEVPALNRALNALVELRRQDEALRRTA